MQRWKLIEIGRQKISREVVVRDHTGLIWEIKKCLASREIEIDFNEDFSIGNVYVGMFRHVGKVERIKSEV